MRIKSNSSTTVDCMVLDKKHRVCNLFSYFEINFRIPVNNYVTHCKEVKLHCHDQVQRMGAEEIWTGGNYP